MHRKASPLTPLPIDAALPEILGALSHAGAVVVVAPPGTGKTTRLPPALIAGDLGQRGRCLVQQPRRIAARAAARRVAEERGWELGKQVGYETRFDTRRGPRTGLIYLTEGILTSRMQSDPLLEGVGTLVIDEFHERSLEADLSLALLQEIRSTVRPDLWVAVLSATLEAGPVASFLGAELVEIQSPLFPVDISYQERPDPSPLPRRAAAAVRRLWPSRPGGRGNLLVFLPGASDIRRTAGELAPWADAENVKLVPLHGDLPAASQDAALMNGADGQERVVLSTNIAETSVTVAGLSAVVDSGLAKQLRNDPQTGLDRLTLVPISRSSATQRAGRAGRLGPGRVLRLWTRHDESSRPERDVPEVLRADLCRAVLEILAWGATPASFRWFEAPSPDRLRAAQETLQRLGAVDGGGRMTALGEAMRRFPLHPRLARLVLESARFGLARQGAGLAALLSERDILASHRAFGGSSPAVCAGSSDLLHRLSLLEEAEGERFHAHALRRLDLDEGAVRAVARSRDQIERLARTTAATAEARSDAPDEIGLLRAIWAAYPDRVARRRTPESDRFVLVGGSGARLARDSSVQRGELVVAVRLEGGPQGEQSERLIRWASLVEAEWLAELGPLVSRAEVLFDHEGERVCAVRKTLYLDLCLREQPVPPPPEAASALLAAEAGRDPLAALRPGPEAKRLLARCRFLGRILPASGIPTWTPEDWGELLGALCRGRTSFEELRKADLVRALRAHLGHERLALLDQHAPERVEVPSKSRLVVEYPDTGPPFLAVRIQEVFGWRKGPAVANGTVPVLLHLLAPSGRPLQVTDDLESFWSRTYPEVRKEMRGRYPKHHWPEDPWSAPPTRKTTHKPPSTPPGRRSR